MSNSLSRCAICLYVAWISYPFACQAQPGFSPPFAVHVAAGPTIAFMEIPDCNSNGTPDHLDISAGTSDDCNTDGTPDECEPTGWFQLAKLVSLDPETNDYLGNVAISGDTLIIGVPRRAHGGAAYAGEALVFEHAESGWILQDRLIPDDIAAGDFFGYSVAIDGSTAVIGASGSDTAYGIDTGSVYIFERNDGAWTQQAELVPFDAASGDEVGRAVSISGDTVLLGIPRTNSDSGGGGAAYVFVRHGEAWAQQAKLVAPDAGDWEYFGYSVAINGDTALVGLVVIPVERTGSAGPRADRGIRALNTPERVSAHRSIDGSAYVFHRSGTPDNATWHQEAKLSAPDTVKRDDFGARVAISGKMILVSAHLNSHSDASHAGAAYVFAQRAGIWAYEAKLVADDASAFDYFGVSVALSGDTALLGARAKDGPDGADVGAAYIYRRTGDVWSQQSKLLAADGAAADFFGQTVSLDEDYAVVCAVGTDLPGAAQAGAAYVFQLDADCNANGTLSVCDIAAGTSEDCDGNQVPDECEYIDCNTNGIHDPCDILQGALDCDDDGIPDGCQLVDHDCNRNGIPDHCDLANCPSGAPDCSDCNLNQVPDGCELIGNDCNANGLPDDCELVYDDCNTNARPDSCDIAAGTSADCDADRTPDECEPDCDSNSFPDDCDLIGGTAADCNSNYVVDECELDCNGNAIPDECDIAAGTGLDCNQNSVPDVCDLHTWGQRARLDAADAASSDRLGYSVAINGDTAVVGSPYDDHSGGTDAGSAYIFVRTAGSWTQQAKLTAADAVRTAMFGFSVSLYKDTAIVGALGDDHEGGSNAGSAYIFMRNGQVWTQQAKLVATDAAAVDGFGCSVSVSGDIAVVGAAADNHAGGNDAGSAYVFLRSGTNWTQQAKLVGMDTVSYDQFGNSVSCTEDSAIIGAYRNDSSGLTDAGAAYVFVRGAGAWTQQAKLIANGTAAYDWLGVSVAIDGDTALIGAGGRNHSGMVDAGTAYVFVRSTGIWTQQAAIIAADASAGDRFGTSVSLRRDSAIVGAPLAHGESGAGLAYIFQRTGSEWWQQSKLGAADESPLDHFGYAVAIDNGSVLMGADADDIIAGANAGSVYVQSFGIDCNANSTLDECELNAVVDCNNDGLLDECAPVGDVTGNGIIDLGDLAALTACLGGPSLFVASYCCLADLDHDADADLADFATMQIIYATPSELREP